METICIKVKIKKGALDAVHKWFQTLNERSDEVMQTLENEDVAVESVFLDRQGEEDYLIYYMKAKSIQKAREVALNSSLDIDKYHKKCFKEYCEDRIEIKSLIDFERL